MQELGADEAVDYTEQRFEEVYRNNPFDGVIDCLGGAHVAGRARSLFLGTCCGAGRARGAGLAGRGSGRHLVKPPG